MFLPAFIVLVSFEAVFLQEHSDLQHLSSDVNMKCKNKKDGNYVISDVFSYLHCNNQKGSLVPCPTNQIFDAGTLKCADANKFNLKNFCVNRLVELSGNYRNPWNCHGFIICNYGIAFPLNCSNSLPLIYDPYLNQCLKSSSMKCKEVKRAVLKADDQCFGKPDGDYAIRDVYKYIHCKNLRLTGTFACPKNNIFEPGHGKCVDISTQTVENFCHYRANGDFLNPWNCHTLFKCLNRLSYVIPCQLPILVFNPYSDQCVYPQKYTCKNIAATISSSNNPCESKSDGVYPTADVFGYLQCKDHVATNKTCSGDDVFDPKGKKCLSSKNLSKTTFCVDRSDGNYRDPWDCHKFVSCVHGAVNERVCAEKDLVYDPFNNLCEYPFIFQCKEMNSSTEDDECKGKKNGKYPINDVLEYLTCTDGKATYTRCAQGSSFDATRGLCVKIQEEIIDSFCINRTDGDWANPHNCYSYLLCKNGHTTMKPCLINRFVFNPYFDVCVRPEDYPCNHAAGIITEESSSDNTQCANKKDGNYELADVFSYYECKNGKATNKTCAHNQVYSSKQKKCVDGSTLSKKTFCMGKNGDYQDPWDCHSYISCFHNQFIERPCAIKTLVYNPYDNSCEYPSKYQCRSIKENQIQLNEYKKCIFAPGFIRNVNPCQGKIDGKYPVRNVFKYLVCTNMKSSYKFCNANEIYDPNPSVEKCVNPKLAGITFKNFCEHRCNGDWQDPWQCHDFFLCFQGINHRLPCSRPPVITVFDTVISQCDQIHCKQLDKDVESTADDHVTINDICTTLPDGYYATRNVFRILTCSKKVSSYIDCPPGTIYIPGDGKTCTDAKNINEKNFCDKRTEGNYQNPWDCHSYYTCSSGYIFPRICSQSTVLNYDPDNDICEFPTQRKCQQLSKSVETYHSSSNNNMDEKLIKFTPNVGKSDEACSSLPDGYYGVRDVGVFILCFLHSQHYINCPKGQIYIPDGSSNCVSIKKINQDNFCHNRPDGNWRNPWNCHHFVACVGDRFYDRKCSLEATLVYNPYVDLCVYPYDYSCKEI